MDILQQEWDNYERDCTAASRIIISSNKAAYELGASVILGAYLTGKLNKKTAQAVFTRINHDILSRHPEME
jgi:hypothetical protein